MEYTTNTNKHVCMNPGSWSSALSYGPFYSRTGMKISSNPVHGLGCIY